MPARPKTKTDLSPKDGKSETISELAHRHLRDKNHTTTDEELKNARIELNDSSDTSVEALSAMANIDNDTVLPPLPFEKKDDSADNKTSDSGIPGKSVPNPYNILG